MEDQAQSGDCPAQAPAKSAAAPVLAYAPRSAENFSHARYALSLAWVIFVACLHGLLTYASITLGKPDWLSGIMAIVAILFSGLCAVIALGRPKPLVRTGLVVCWCGLWGAIMLPVVIGGFMPLTGLISVLPAFMYAFALATFYRAVLLGAKRNGLELSDRTNPWSPFK